MLFLNLCTVSYIIRKRSINCLILIRRVMLIYGNISVGCNFVE